MREHVLHYYYTLRSVLKNHPHLRNYRVRCKHCRIYFLTHPRNAGRCDLRCPFGCRQAHRKEASKKRSLEYYRSYFGRGRKKYLNSLRSKEKGGGEPPQNPQGGDSREKEPEIHVEKETIVYIQTVTTLIEGRPVSKEEIIAMLKKRMRQLSIDMRRRSVYAFHYPREKPG